MLVVTSTGNFYWDFNNYFKNDVVSSNIKDIPKADLVIFTGGEDVDPILYGEKINGSRGTNPARDMVDLYNFTVARNWHKKIWGVCRGSQFINVIMGGRINQDIIDGHGFFHGLNGKFNYEVNSTHHQGIVSVGKDMEIISTHKNIVEIAKSLDNKILTTQFHPEFRGFPSEREFKEFFMEWFNE